MKSLVTKRRIEFSDTDLGGVVHHSRYFVFMETAEDNLLRSIGTSFHFNDAGCPGGWPKVTATCDYLAPLHYGDEIEIQIVVARVSRSAVTYEFSFRRKGEEVARGRTVSVFCLKQPGGAFASAPLPETLVAALIHPAE